MDTTTPAPDCDDCGHVGEHTAAVCVRRIRAALASEVQS